MNYYFDTDKDAQNAADKHSESCGFCHRGYWLTLFDDDEVSIYGSIYEQHHDAVLCTDKFVFRKAVIP